MDLPTTLAKVKKEERPVWVGSACTIPDSEADPTIKGRCAICAGPYYGSGNHCPFCRAPRAIAAPRSC
jgi:hypothetical protein